MTSQTSYDPKTFLWLVETLLEESKNKNTKISCEKVCETEPIMDESVDFNDSMMDLDLLMKEEDPFALIKDMIPPGRFRFRRSN